jgi:hypothetical protein
MILVALVAVGLTAASMFGDDRSADFRRGYELGRREADAQISSGAVTIYSYGLVMSLSNFDPETGLPFQPIAGCVVDDRILGRAQGHNERVLQYVKSGKTPTNSHKDWTDDLNQLLRTYTSQTRLQKPVRLTAGGPPFVSPDGRFKIQFVCSECDQKKPLAPMHLEARLMILAPGAKSPKGYACVHGKNPMDFVFGPRGSGFGVIRTETPERVVDFQAVDLHVPCLLKGESHDVTREGLTRHQETAEDF